MIQDKLQGVIFTKLATVGFPVYDAVPQGAAFPYIVIGDDTSVYWNTDDSTGEVATVTIHTWSTYHGRLEVKQMQAAIAGVLDRAEFEIDGGDLVNIELEFQQTMLGNDNITRHGVQRFRATIEHTA